VVGDLDLVPLDRAVQDVACDIGDSLLPTFDALHLASALLLGEALTAFIAYDQRLAQVSSGRRPGRRSTWASQRIQES